MRTTRSTRILLWISLAATLLVWPADALAQRGRGGRGHGGGRAVAARPVRPVYARPYYRSYYRPYYYGSYRPYFYSSLYWGAWGYPYYSPYFGWGYPYGYPAYYRSWDDDLGALRIEAKPREAQVYVDGYFAGLVDDFDGMSQRLRAKPGEHQIEIYLDGHQPFREKILFRPGNTVKIKHVLQPLAAGEAPPARPEPIPAPATPAPSASPRTPYRDRPSAGVEVEPSPAVPADEPPPPGPGTPADTRSAYGSVSIRVQPGDAVVLIDGERWEGGGVRDRLVIELSEGTHRIEVQKDGFAPYSTEVRVRRGQVSTLNVSLLSAREI